MSGIIYRITNVDNGKVYIGQSRHPLEKVQRRYQKEIRYKRQRPITRALAKYGFASFVFDVVENAVPLDELDARESYWIAHFKAQDSLTGYNLATGGRGTNGYQWTEEAKARLGARQRQLLADPTKNPFYGRTHTQHARDAVAASNRRRKGMKTRPHSEQTRARIGASLTGKMCGADNHRYKAVDADQLAQLIVEGNSVAAIAKAVGISQTHVYDKLRLLLGYSSFRAARRGLCNR